MLSALKKQSMDSMQSANSNKTNESKGEGGEGGEQSITDSTTSISSVFSITTATSTSTVGSTATPTPIPQDVDDMSLHPINQTGDVINGGSRYAAPTPIKTSEAVKAASNKEIAPKPNLLPLVIKRMLRLLGYQQTQMVALGRVVHYMIAERINVDGDEGGDSSDQNMMRH